MYARRFVSRKTGRAGYSPVCGSEWAAGICRKPRVKCSDCPHQNWLPVDDEVVRAHLTGEIVMGIYPMLADETCHFLAIDFDGGDWRGDALAFWESCLRHGVPAAVERSRSGDGAHVWVFFSGAVPATLARGLGTVLLAETMTRRAGLGMKSYDRFFPNQDTLPRGGFGNLIALPLQGEARKNGNSVFVDGDFRPHADQWAFLAGLEKFPAGRIAEVLGRAGGAGGVPGVRAVVDDDDVPWTGLASAGPGGRPPGPLPESVEVVMADGLYFEKTALPAALRNRLVRMAAFQNPEFYRAQAMRLSVSGKPRVISCAEESARHLILPRGCLDDVRTEFRRLGVQLAVRDERCGGRELAVSFRGELRPGQLAAAEAMLAHETGVLAATTAFGKTVVAAWIIARRGVSTLVLVHRRQLLDQWVGRMSEFLGIPEDAIGRFGGGRCALTGLLDIATIQSLVRKGNVDARVAGYGQLVVDECHHLPASSFELVSRRARARFVAGFSATVTRKDGHHPIIFLQCGPVRHTVDARKQAAARPFAHRVLVRPTGFRDHDAGRDEDPRATFGRLVDALSADENRNRLICGDVAAALRDGRAPIVLTERTDHLETLESLLAPMVDRIITLRGGMGRKAMRDALARMAEGPHVLLATGRFVGEGFDHPVLDTLFLALPVSWRGTIAQYAGRLHRLRDGKREVRIYDYADLDVPMLERMFNKRCAGYEAIGYEIHLPASAVPGWPVDVPLPADPLWKRDYAASVRRLIRDGVAPPLAGLFLAAARKFADDAAGIARARSSSEAFFLARLESLPATRGRFRLNAEVPIPFDNAGKMEVDFLCERARLVIELDGAQHLADEDAYRRDRRKDAALQQNGFFVLRFLASDAARRLDAILDAVVAALAHLDAKNPNTT